MVALTLGLPSHLIGNIGKTEKKMETTIMGARIYTHIYIYRVSIWVIFCLHYKTMEACNRIMLVVIQASLCKA